MLRLYHSNRVEKLVEKLIEIVGPPLANPMAPEIVVTQSQGMAHWLFVQLAQNQTIAANIRFELPASFVWDVFHSLLDDVPVESKYEVDVLAWRILDRLPQCLDREEFQPLRHYLAEDDSELKRYQLARRIADVLDQYLIYRPQMITDWEQSKDSDWQAALWREVSAKQRDRHHRAALIEKFQRFCTEGRMDSQQLPQRVSVFGISAMPPAYLEVFHRIAEWIEVHLFLFNPCLLYWGDIKDEKTQRHFRKKRKTAKRTESDDHYTVGNTLLASWGKQGQDFINLIHDFSPYVEEELFEANAGDTLLRRIQSDVLFLEDPCIVGEVDSPACSKTIISAVDDSILVQACHSPMREVQVLHDRLLALFDKDPSLTLKDVVVMTPDIEKYAPYVEAVFGDRSIKDKNIHFTQHHQRPSLPCSIADRSRTHESPLFQAFIQLLELPASRFTATEVLALLETPAILQRFDLEPEDFERIRLWVKECGIRWGTDRENRAGLGLPDTNANTWQFGLERMLVGYAMAPTQTLFQGIAPYDQIEGTQAQILGKFYTFYETLLLFKERLNQRYDLDRWGELVTDLTEAFFQVNDDDQRALLTIHQIKDDLLRQVQLAHFQDNIGVQLIREYFVNQFSQTGFQQRFFTGQVTFCAMLPMRSIPFKVVCLIGMNDAGFPRKTSEPGFNRMKQHPMQGDRSRRDDDRYLFLEALLSSRQHFYISFIGKSIRDNQAMLPSVLVSELLDYIEQGFCFDANGSHQEKNHTGIEAIREKLVVYHPLQPFSRRYFDRQSELFSYADEWFGSTVPHDRPKQPPEPFITTPLEAPDKELRLVDLNQLIRFFTNPAEFFLKARLSMHIPGLEESIEDAEPFNLDGLQSYVIGQNLLEHKVKGGDLEKQYMRFKADGHLPQACFGDLVGNNISEKVEACALVLEPYTADPLEALEVNLKLNQFSVTGHLDHLTKNGQLSYRIASIKAKDHLRLWIRHLILNILNPENCKLDSFHIGRDEIFGLLPVTKPRFRLEQLLDLYWKGLSQPLAFFPETSFAYAEALQQDKDPWQAVRKVWEGSEFHNIPGDGADPYVVTAFRGVNPFDKKFAEVAATVFQPLLAAQMAQSS